MRKTKKALATLAIAGMVLSMAPLQVFGATTASTADRLYGADRYETAVKVADAGWTTANTAIVAPGADANLVDALAAAPLAGQENAPILLTDNNALTAATKAELVKLGVKKVYAVGAIGDAVVNELKGMGVTVEVLKGTDRIDTAAKVTAKLTAPAGTFVVGYDALADAMSVASFAAANKYAIAVANPDGTVDASKLVGTTKYVIGGPTLVKDVAGATRIYGADRFETNQKVLAALSFEYSKAYVANGETLVDALVASALAAKAKAPIVLANNAGAKAAADVSAKLKSDSVVVALGGTAVVPDAVRDSVKYVAPATLAVQSVTVLNSRQLQVVFNKEVNSTAAETGANYKIYDKSGNTVALVPDNSGGNAGTTNYGAVLQDDNKTVILTLAAAITTKTDLTVVVTKSISAKDDSTQYAPLYSKVVTVDDQTAPDVTKVESKTKDDTTKKVTVYFSEPIASAAFKIDGKAATVAWEENNTKAILTAAEDLNTSDTHKLEVVNATDGADNVASLVTRSFTITKDVTAPTITSVTQYSDYKVLVTFSKKMDPATVVDANVKAVDSTLNQHTVTVAPEADDDTDTQFVVTLAGVTYDSDHTSKTFTLSFSSDITDSLGNELDTVTKQITLTRDNVGANVTSIVVDKDSSNKVTDVKVKFDEPISNVDLSKLTIVNKNGVDVTNDILADSTNVKFTSYSIDGKTVKLILNTPTKLTDTYTFIISKAFAKDAAVSPNDSIAYTGTVDFGAGDPEKFELTGTPVTVVSTNKYQVNYGRQVKGGSVAGSATDISRYTLNGSTLPAGTTITLDSTREIATITLPSSSVADSDASAIFTIIGVQDLDGNVITPYTTTVPVVDNIKPVLQSASLYSFDNSVSPYSATIILTFNENVTVSSAGADVSDELAIKVGGDDKAISTAKAYVVPGKDKQIRVDFTFATPLDTNKTISIKTIDGNGDIRDVSSLNNEAKADIAVTVAK